MTSLEKLDFVLNAMDKVFWEEYRTLTEITKDSKILGKININELPAIINKLNKDAYIDFELNDSKDIIFDSEKKYRITFEGKLLNESGGYRWKIKRESTLTNLQSLQTWVIAIGTALAGLYGIYQLINALL